MLSHKFNVHTTVHMHSKSLCSSAESKAKSAISMVFADCVRNSVLISIGSSLHTCDPPTSQARLLAGNQDEHGFCDGQRGDARLSTVAGVAVARDGSIFFTDWMNHCVREITTGGYVRTLYGTAPKTTPESGFSDGYGLAARFHRPWGLCLCFDETELIVVDGFNSSLRRINRGTSHVATVHIEQDMSRTLAAPDVVVQPTQLLYPSTVQVAPTGQHVFVVNGSGHQILKINLATMIYHLVPWSPEAHDNFRPVCMDVTASGMLLVAYTGYDKNMSMRNTKIVSFGDLQLFCAERDVIHYRLRGKIEVGACVSCALAVHKQTHDASVWIADCRSESRLLRVRLELKWSFLRVLLLAVLKPHAASFFSLLPVFSHKQRIVCPLLQHIVKMLQGVCAFG